MARATGYPASIRRRPPVGTDIMAEIDTAELDHAIVAYELGDYVGARRGFERAAAAGNVTAAARKAMRVQRNMAGSLHKFERRRCVVQP